MELTNQYLCKMHLFLYSSSGQPFDPHLKIHNAVSNVICAITFGERFDYHDEQFHDLLRLLEEAMYLGSSIMVHVSILVTFILEEKGTGANSSTSRLFFFGSQHFLKLKHNVF